MDLLEATIRALTGKLEESKEVKNESVLKDIYNELDASKEVKNVEGLIDDILVVTDPEVTSEEFEEVLANANEIVEGTPEGDLPFDDRYIGEYLMTCPVCGSSFVSHDILEPGASCPICFDQPEAFILVGRLETEEDVAEKEGVVSSEEDVEEVEAPLEDTILDKESEEIIPEEELVSEEDVEEVANELDRDLASKEIPEGNILTESKVEENTEVVEESEEILEEAVMNFKKYGITRAPELDFSDDGARFSGYMCNGVPITYLKDNGMVFLDIRVDYLKGLNYDEYSKLPSYKETDSYNGVDEDQVDLADVVDICNRIKAEYEEAVGKVTDVSDDDFKAFTDKYLEKAKAEYEEAKAEIRRIDPEDMLNAPDYVIRRMRDYLSSVKKNITDWSWEVKSNVEQHRRREMMTDRMSKYYDKVSFYLTEIKEMVESIVNKKQESLVENKQDDIKAIMAIVNESVETEKLEETGEWDDEDEEMSSWIEDLRGKVEELAKLIDGEVKVVKGFDKYQGPFAIVHTPKHGDIEVWYDDQDDTGFSLVAKVAHAGWIQGGVNQLVEILNKDDITADVLQEDKKLSKVEETVTENHIEDIISRIENAEDSDEIQDIIFEIEDVNLEEQAQLAFDECMKDEDDLDTIKDHVSVTIEDNAEYEYKADEELDAKKTAKFLSDKEELNEEKLVKFSVDGEEKVSYTAEEEFEGEREATKELVAQENGVSVEDVEVTEVDTEETEQPATSNKMLSVNEENTEVYVSKNSYGYNVIGIIVDNNNKRFQIVDGQALPIGKYTKSTSKKIFERAADLMNKGYEKYTGEHSLAAK